MLPEPQIIKDRITSILKDKNISQSQFLKDNDLNPMTFQNMTKFYPRLDTIAIIADSLDVSIDSIISGPSESESAFIAMMYFCRINERDQKLIMSLMKEMSVATKN